MGSNRVFNLRCANDIEYNIWIKKLNYSINSSLGKQKKLTMELYKDDINNWFDFWRFLRINEKNFVQQAEIGDLILCQSKRKIALTQEPVFDKICLLVKLQEENQIEAELYVLRVGPSLNHPLVLQKWEEFRIFRTQRYSDCMYRHLHCVRDEAFLAKT